MTVRHAAHPRQRPALLVVDVQNYFFDRRSPAFLPGAPALLPRINLLVAAAATAGWPVVCTVHHAPSSAGNLMAERWDHLPSGWEAELHPGLRCLPGCRVVAKQHFSAFHRTGLAAALRRRGTTHLVLCGVMTHLCVDTTARHGFMLGLRPVVAGDACCSKDAEYHRAALRCLRHGFARVGTTAAILKAMPCAI